MKRPIALGLAPNLEKIDAILALKLILFPSIYLKGDEESKLSQWFKNYFKVKYAYSFASARGALTSLLLSKDIGKGDEVILQAF
ncbi:MAG TPA: DegT/DnrJ/EryC1/StrS family aminotransferase, partial [Patescibacteria group bacterium]